MVLLYETALKAVFSFMYPLHRQEIVWMEGLLTFRLL
jgi:hypothetical protein